MCMGSDAHHDACMTAHCGTDLTAGFAVVWALHILSDFGYDT